MKDEVVSDGYVLDTVSEIVPDQTMKPDYVEVKDLNDLKKQKKPEELKTPKQPETDSTKTTKQTETDSTKTTKQTVEKDVKKPKTPKSPL